MGSSGEGKPAHPAGSAKPSTNSAIAALTGLSALSGAAPSGIYEQARLSAEDGGWEPEGETAADSASLLRRRAPPAAAARGGGGAGGGGPPRQRLRQRTWLHIRQSACKSRPQQRCPRTRLALQDMEAHSDPHGSTQPRLHAVASRITRGRITRARLRGAAARRRRPELSLRRVAQEAEHCVSVSEAHRTAARSTARDAPERPRKIA